MNMHLTVTGINRILIILLFFIPIIAPFTVLAEKKGTHVEVSPTVGEKLKFLSSEMPPFGVLKNGKPRGLVVDIQNEIMRRLGRADSIEFNHWNIVYERALTEPNTVLWPPSRTPEREHLFKWVGPLIPEKIVFYARKDSKLIIESLEEANNVAGIATVSGFASENLLKEKGFTNLVSQRSQTQAPDALKFGRADLWISSNITMKQTSLDANVDPDLFEPVFVVKEIPSYLAFSKSVPDILVNRWQSTLDEMKRDGSWERIISQWIPREQLMIGISPAEQLGLSAEESNYLSTIKQITFCADPDWMPYEGIDDDGKYEGMIADFMGLLSKRLDVPLRLYATKTWEQTLKEMQRGSCDIIAAASATELRKQWLNFSHPYLKFPLVIAVPSKQLFIENMAEVQDKVLGVVKNYAHIDLIREKFPNLKIHEVDNVNDGLQKVQSGDLFGYIDTVATISHGIHENGMLDLKIGGKLDTSVELSIALRNGESPLLLSIINKSIKTITAAEKREILNKWAPVRYEQAFDYVLFWKVLIIAALLLLLILFWNRKLSSLNYRIMQSENLMRSTLESIKEGVLVVDELGRVIHTNTHFQKMWGISEQVLASHDNEQLTKILLKQLENPQSFLSRVEALSRSTESSSDIIKLRDGRTLERYSIPLVQNGVISGRVWCF